MFSVLLMYAISAYTFVLAKELLLYSSPLFLVGVRTLIAGALFLIMYACTKKQILKNIKKFLVPCAFIALYSFYLSNTLKFWALTYLSTTQAAIISIIEPLFAMAIAYFMFNERMSIKKWMGMIFCMCSALLLTFASSAAHLLTVTVFSVPACILCLAIGASTYGALLMRKLIHYQDASPMLVNGMSMTMAGILALTTTCIETSSHIVTNTIHMPLDNLAMMILLSNILAYSLYGYLLKRYSVLLITCGSFAKPIFVALYKGIFFHESMSVYMAFATLLLLAGLIMIWHDESNREYVYKTM